MIKEEYKYSEKDIDEIKTLSKLTDAHLAQALNYPEVMNPETRLLTNFDSTSLEIKRLINNKYKPAVKSGQSA